jgi:hypothetical protein
MAMMLGERAFVFESPAFGFSHQIMRADDVEVIRPKYAEHADDQKGQQQREDGPGVVEDVQGYHSRCIGLMTAEGSGFARGEGAWRLAESSGGG